MTLAVPSADAQLSFLAKLQRIFTEGDFTATYKYGLLIALADLCVELGADDGSDLLLTTRQIAERFIAMYWRHAAPYGEDRSGGVAAVLVQNLGAQAAVLTAIGQFRGTTGATTLVQARSHPAYGSLVTEVAATVSAQPLEKLQNFGGTNDAFLYERSRGKVRLRPGIPFCFRRFYPLVLQLSRAHWVDHIKSNQRNRRILGDGGDLEDFLFSTSRQALTVVARELRKVDGDECFYCRSSVSNPDVDHFVPFSLYGRDIAHNFVLAHAVCNRSKSDTLAAKMHLDRWLERLTRRSDDLSEIGRKAGVAADGATCRHVAGWAYGNVHASGGRAWMRAETYEPVGSEYLAVLAVPKRVPVSHATCRLV